MRECHAISNSVALEEPKRPRLDDCERPGSSRSSRGCGRRNRSPRRDEEDHQGYRSPDTFQEEQRVVNIIFGGSSVPSCKRSMKLHNRSVNSVFRHPVEPLHRSEIPITFDRRDHWVHLLLTLLRAPICIPQAHGSCSFSLRVFPQGLSIRGSTKNYLRFSF